ncbi:50S rRNA methyltransferase [Elstera litoralis]|uniref:Ribosomal RNA large subunit methyltransferase H n=1 Tax=Elstera litoralis TaxID=552518 RepID=A0A0F3IWW2_9PROT|nr:23S rRNA (pseudouridine(1915)-N(3))-methyltransferase RlmH [Elstera litoralis]KJV10079.1 50S rRNA methyltransferase [Elstera litoralis]
MRVHLLAVGRCKEAAIKSLVAEYGNRLRPALSLIEVEERRALPAAELKAREGQLLLEAVPKGATLVALDEHGKSLSSQAFADQIGRWRDSGVADLAFAIGGADGHDAALLDRADFKLSLSPLTWPHMLVRVMLAEQVYRAHSILAGHPYHRE